MSKFFTIKNMLCLLWLLVKSQNKGGFPKMVDFTICWTKILHATWQHGSAPCSTPFTWWLWCDVHVHDDNWAQDQWRAHVWARADSRGARPAWKEPQFLRLVMFLMECRSVCGICIILYFWTWWVFGHTHIFFASCSLIYSCESRKVKGEELWFDERFNIIWLARHTMCLIRDCLASNISTS